MSVFNEQYKRYDAWYEKNRFAYLSELEAIKSVLPGQGTGLEIGVGTGRFAGPLQIAYGVDPSLNMLKLAKGRGVTVVQARGEHLPFSSGSFDYVALFITLCFLTNPEKVLHETRRVLKKTGRAVLSIISRNSLLGELYKKKDSDFYREARIFSHEEAAGLLVKCGFGKIEYAQTLFGIPGELIEIEKPREGFNAGSFIVLKAEPAHDKTINAEGLAL